MALDEHLAARGMKGNQMMTESGCERAVMEKIISMDIFSKVGDAVSMSSAMAGIDESSVQDPSDLSDKSD